MTKPKRITLAAAARSLGVGVRDLLRLHREGSLPVEVSKGAGGNRYVDREAFERRCEGRFRKVAKRTETAIEAVDPEAITTLSKTIETAIGSLHRVAAAAPAAGQDASEVKGAVRVLRSMAEALEASQRRRAVGVVDWS